MDTHDDLPLRGSVTPERAREQAEMLGNRVLKTHRKLAPRMERDGIGAFRLYDRDIPEIRAIVDWYEGHLVVAEHERRQTQTAGDWLGIMAQACSEALGVPAENVHVRRRRTRPAEGDRYERLARTDHRLVVREGDLRFLVNLDDYLDTGLFLDHRITRRLVAADAAGRSLLNLFAYTGAFTVAAAKAGARQTTSVDQSGTYLEWLRANLELNGVAPKAHATARADVIPYVRDVLREGLRWDVVVLDPPSFSSVGGSRGIDVQRDHKKLALASLALLKPGGVLWLSVNHQRFTPDVADLPAREIVEMTDRTIPPDFRNKLVHRCWRIVSR